MKPWILIDSAPIPGGGEMTLHRHVRDFAIRVGRDELMNSGTHGSEEALADLAAKRLGARAEMHVLVGGLGMGFTVAATVRVVPSDGRITVAELVPAVVTWNRGPLAHLAGNPLADPRVEVHTGDVAALLRSQVAAYDLILLDVDNGPHGLTTGDNHWLYGSAGLAAAHRALRANGVLAVWSAGPDDAFTKRLGKAGFVAEALRVAAHGSKGRKHVIWLATARQGPTGRQRP